MPIPKLRFKNDHGQDYPEWEYPKLSDVFEYITDKKHPMDEVLTIKQGIGTVPRKESGIDIKYDPKSLSNYKQVQKDDFIIHLRSFQSGFEIANAKGIVSPAYTILRKKTTIAIPFYRAYFRTNSFINHNLNIVVEGIRDGRTINITDLKNRPIPYPILTEQQEIANFLTSYDRMIDCQSQRVEAMKTRKKGLLQKIFSQKIRFRDEQGREYPEWLKATFGNLFLALRKNALARDTLNYEHGNIKNIHYGDILVGFGATVQSTSPLVPYINADKIPKSYDILQCGDIIIADTAEDETAGKGIEIINDSIPTISGLHTLPYRPQTKFAPGYLGYFLNSPNYHKQLIPLLHGIKVLSVTKAELEKTIISYPTLPEQQKIADFLSAVDTQIEVEETRLETMKIIKKGLLQQMFI